MVIAFQQYISVIYGQLIKTIKGWTWFIIGWILYMVIALQQYFSHMWTVEGRTCYTKKLTVFSDPSHHTFTIKTFFSGLKYDKKIRSCCWSEYFGTRKNLPLLDQDLPPKNCRSQKISHVWWNLKDKDKGTLFSHILERSHKLCRTFMQQTVSSHSYWDRLDGQK